jgi:predicted outer membrane repeat protein
MLTLLLLFCPWASGATISVDTNGSGPFTTIQSAIWAASNGDTIEVHAGTYVESLDTYNKNLTFLSSKGKAETSIDANGADWVIETGDANLQLSGFTIRNEGGRGIYSTGGEITVEDASFINLGNDASDGGALYLSNTTTTISQTIFENNIGNIGGAIFFIGKTLSITESVFENNYSDYGGAIYGAYAPSLSVSLSTFDRNYAYDGGALYVVDTETTVSDTTFDYNVGDNYGGGIYLANSTLSVASSEFKENSGGYGGAIYQSNAPSLSVNDTTFDRNYGLYDGGAIFNYAVAAVTSENNFFDANTAANGRGGALSLSTSAVFIDTGSSYIENFAYFYGGALETDGVSSITISDGVFRENSSYYSGGALYITYGSGSATLTNTTFENNEALYVSGGGIYAYLTDLIMDNVSLTNNQSGNSGGGLSHHNGAFSLQNCTFTSNKSTARGGAIESYYAGENSLEGAIIVGTVFEHNQAGYEGGAIALVAPYFTSHLVENTFNDNVTTATGFGGGIYATYPQRIVIQRNKFSGNQSGYGAGLYITGSAAWDPLSKSWGDVVTNNILLNNTADTGGALCLSQTAYISVMNNTMAGNVAHDTGGTACLYDVDAQFYNNIFSFTTESEAIHTYAGDSDTYIEFAYNDWYRNDMDNLGGAVKTLSNTALTIPPQFANWTHNGDPSDDSVVLSLESNLRDAGHPKILDPDGSRADIGAYGGPDAQTDDQDEDGFDTTLDCDDTNADIHPGAPDTPYDGVNSDCLPGSDYDLDGDGVDAAEYGGEDCDDTDPTITTPCDDTTSTNDTVTPGEKPLLDPEPDSACGCSAASRSAPLYLLTILSLFIISRRKSGQPHAIHSSR